MANIFTIGFVKNHPNIDIPKEIIIIMFITLLVNLRALPFPDSASILVNIGIYVLCIATHNSDIKATVIIFRAIKYESETTPAP